MLFWQKARICKIDKGVLADTLNAYARKLAEQESIPSGVDGQDHGDRDLILEELARASEDIRTGRILVARLTMQDAWVTTSNELLRAHRENGAKRPLYERAVTVAQHMHNAFEPLK